MKILIINHYAGSPKMGMAYRPYYLAKEWMKNGHEVVILCADFSHLRKERPEVKNDFEIIYEEGVKYCVVKTPEYKGNGVRRIVNMFTFILKIRFNLRKVIKIISPDVVISSSTYPLDNYIAHRISKKTKAQHIFEVHDLWPLSPMELGNMSKYHPFILIMQAAENFAYKKADKVVSMLPETKEHMKIHGLDLNKWFHVPNGIVTSEKNNHDISDEYKELFNRLKEENKKIIMYAGGHALSNSLNTIIEAAKISNDKFAYVFIGNGTEKEKIVKQAEGLNNVFFLEPVPKNQIQTLLSYADLLAIVWNKSPLYRFGISPNKIFDYMMASKPIIHATDAPNKFTDIANCGVAVEPENPKILADAINNLFEMTDEDLIQIGKNGKEYVLKNHDYKVLAENFIDIINNVK